MIDISEKREVIEAINAILNTAGIAEVKREKSGITVVQIKRTVVAPKKEGGSGK